MGEIQDKKGTTMSRAPQANPYTAFKNDKERGRTLRSQHRWNFSAHMVRSCALGLAITFSGNLPLKEFMTWFSKLPL
jgi:hypothetical protein